MILVFIFSSGFTNAGVFKWVDENGNTHFGDRPQSKSVKEIKINKNKGPDKHAIERRNRQNQFLEDRVNELTFQEAPAQEERKSLERFEAVKAEAEDEDDNG